MPPDHAGRSAIDEATAAFLGENDRAYLYVRAADGAPRGWPMTARYDAGVLVMTTYRKSAKMVHLGSASPVTLVVTCDEGVEPVRYAVAHGMLRISDIDAGNADAVIRRMRFRDQLVGSPHRSRYRERLMQGKRVLLEVDVARAELFTMDSGMSRSAA